MRKHPQARRPQQGKAVPRNSPQVDMQAEISAFEPDDYWQAFGASALRHGPGLKQPDKS